MKFILGIEYNPMHYAPHNVETWENLKPLFDRKTTVDYMELVVAAKGHKGGGRGFVKYLIKHGWIKLEGGE